MHIIKQKNYDYFKCSADQCSITCCMEWKIAVDEKTYTKWKNTTKNGKLLVEHVKGKKDARVIQLDNKKNCPYINNKKLCSLVIEFGEEMLSNTCNTFPRQNKIFPDRVEKSLVSCCPRTMELILEQKGSLYDEILAFDSDDLLFEIRKMLIELFLQGEYSSSDSLLLGFAALIDIINRTNLQKNDMKKYCSMEDCKRVHKYYSKFKVNQLDTFIEGNELFLDIIENYRKEGRYMSYIEPLAKQANYFEKNYSEENKLEYKIFMQEFIRFDYCIKAYLMNELYSNLLSPESDLETLVIQYEWISMEYAILRHSLFLKWFINEKKDLEIEDIIESIVMISRITGYGEDDIYEYLENSFEQIIWEFGYLLLIVK